MTTAPALPMRRAEVEARAHNLLAQMTLDEKIGQMTQVEKNSITPDEVARHGIGSVLSGGGGNPTPNTPAAWAAMVRDFQEGALASRLGIPMLYGVDAVHGHNNMVGATIFPHNIGLGAAGDPALVARTAAVTARELLATHVRWDFAPAVSVARDTRWGRTYESFGRDPALVGRMGAAYVSGLQGANPARPVLACAKHFVADGGTNWGSTTQYPWIAGMWRSTDPQKWQMDQGDAIVDEADLRTIHLAPFADAIAAGARTIMVSYSSWFGAKMHAHHRLLTDVLKGEMGFSGLLVSDWLGVSQLDANPVVCVERALNAGIDMVMVPFDYVGFMAAARQGVEAGRIPMARVDDAVTRILRIKLEMGLFEEPYGDEGLLSQVGGAAHRAVAREAVRKSLVLLRNEGDTLPLPRNLPRLLVAGAADDLGTQCGGWTIEWQGGRGAITAGETLLHALQSAAADANAVEFYPDGAIAVGDRAPVALVVVGEEPYAEGEGDCLKPALSPDDVALVKRVRPHCERLLLVVYSGRPLNLDAVLPLCDAVAAAWLPGTEGGGLADVLFGDAPFTGRLPQPWPCTGGMLFPTGLRL